MLKQIQQWLLPILPLQQIQQSLMPSICCICEQSSDIEQTFCSFCYALLPWLEGRCYRCGLLLEEEHCSVYCQQCLSYPPGFDRLCALFEYQSPISNLITALKFGEKLEYGKILGGIFADKIIQDWYQKTPLPQAVVAVPLHKKRQAKRGYNQALELLWPIQKHLKIPILFNACIRVQKTYPQAKLDKHRRKRNMQGVFKVVAPINVDHIAIMDDVVTTASTVNALSYVLKEAGVKQIDVWCICRA